MSLGCRQAALLALVLSQLSGLCEAIPSRSAHLGGLALHDSKVERRPVSGGLRLRRAGELRGLEASGAVEGERLIAAGSGDAPLAPLRGGAGGLAKKLGGKNVGLLVILLSLLYLPRAASSCQARLIPATKLRKATIQRLGCGKGLAITNVMTLVGLAAVLVNSRQFDRHGRSKLKMRLTGSVIIAMGMCLVIAHAEPAAVSWYSKTNVYVGILMEWWGFVSLFYNFTPKFMAQLPRELGKVFGKMTGGGKGAQTDYRSSEAAKAREREVDRLNRWAQSQNQPQ